MNIEFLCLECRDLHALYVGSLCLDYLIYIRSMPRVSDPYASSVEGASVCSLGCYINIIIINVMPYFEKVWELNMVEASGKTCIGQFADGEYTDVCWTSDRFTSHILLDSNDMHVFLDANDQQVPIVSLNRRHSVWDMVYIPSVRGGAEQSIETVIFERLHTLHGTIFINMFDLYTTLHLTLFPGTASAWCGKYQARWATLGKSLGLGDLCMLPSLGEDEYTDPVSCKDHPLAAIGGHLHPFGSACLSLVLAIACRSSWAKSKRKGVLEDFEARGAFERLALALFDRVPPGSQFDIYLDADAVRVASEFAGKRGFRLHIRDGCVWMDDISELRLS